MPDLITGFALVAIVLTVAGLASEFVNRALAVVLCLEAVRIGNIGMGGAGFVPILSLPASVLIFSVWRLNC